MIDMDTTGRFAIAISLLMLGSVAHGQLITDLSVDVTQEDGIYTYEYTLKNSDFSGVAVNSFFMDTVKGADVIDMFAPENWVSEYTASENNLQALWLAGEGLDCATEDFDVFEGEEISFSLTSTWAPEPQDYIIAKLTADCGGFLGSAEGQIASPSIPPGLACDFDGDGTCDLLDIDLLGTEIGSGTNSSQFDLTGDSLVNINDLDAFLADSNVNRINGDADFDGTVGFPDFLTLSSNFGGEGLTWSQGNFVPDDSVGFPDFLVFSSNFAQTASATATAAVPEPSGLALLLTSLLVLAACRVRKQV